MTITADRGRLAAAKAAEHIVDAFSGVNFGPEVRALRALAVDMLAATLDFEDTPAVELIDDAVRFEIVNRANSNWLMRRTLDRYAEMIEPFEDPFDEDDPLGIAAFEEGR